MPNKSRNNYISVAKAIGIILMVVGHSGCPSAIGRFIYLFHMPLFFVCSGYFFKEIADKASLLTFCRKRIKGLYLPYLKWSLLFLLLHNVFRHFHITGSAIYHAQDYIRQFVRLVTMTDYELLIRPFWFIKELLFASVIVASISIIRARLFQNIGTFTLLFFSLTIAIIAKFLPLIPLIGDCSLLFLSIAYFYSGILIRKYKPSIPFTTSMMILSFIVVLIGSRLFTGTIDMRFTTTKNILPYYLFSLFGVMMLFCISKKLECFSLKFALYYIGNHTMPILALNLLSLKVGSLIKIWIYGMPIERLASYTIIYEHNSTFWLSYTTLGVAIPLLADYIYHSLFLRK
jgi:fucose 4-O-acetylase-like acetyltransferase